MRHMCLLQLKTTGEVFLQLFICCPCNKPPELTCIHSCPLYICIAHRQLSNELAFDPERRRPPTFRSAWLQEHACLIAWETCAPTVISCNAKLEAESNSGAEIERSHTASIRNQLSFFLTLWSCLVRGPFVLLLHYWVFFVGTPSFFAECKIYIFWIGLLTFAFENYSWYKPWQTHATCK